MTTRDATDPIDDQLQRDRRLETIGQLIGVIGHDFNNLLTLLLGNLELLHARLSGDPASARLLSAALKAAERGARLTTQLLAFSQQQQTTAPGEVDLNRLIVGMEGPLQSAVGAGNRIAPVVTDPPCADRETCGLRKAVILVVDDHDDVRATAAEMLRGAGHDVVEAASGRDALDRLDQTDPPVDLMIVDFVMPGMNGVETAGLARLKRPDLPIMYMSGFGNSAVFAAQTDADHVLQKPFRPSDMAVKVQEVLRGASGRLGKLTAC